MRHKPYFIFKNALYEVKQVVSTLVSICFGIPWLGHIIKSNYIKLLI